MQRCNVPDTLVGGVAIYQALNCEVKHNGLILDWTCLDTPLDVLKPSWTCLDVLNPVGRDFRSHPSDVKQTAFNVVVVPG